MYVINKFTYTQCEFLCINKQGTPISSLVLVDEPALERIKKTQSCRVDLLDIISLRIRALFTWTGLQVVKVVEATLQNVKKCHL